MSPHESKIYMSIIVDDEILRVNVSKIHELYAFLETVFNHIPDTDHLSLLC